MTSPPNSPIWSTTRATVSARNWSSRSNRQPDSRFLTKVRHSAFYATSLGYLLTRLQTKRLILTGQVTEQCILYTALDAYVRHFPVVVPHDGVAGIDPALGDAALKMMERNMSAEVIAAADCLP